ncbi:hypothetical protein DVH05_000135 [Phytophthora capsici]|nr:hypothetical protein DVH05_000135 [Phytophthora capsici]
MHNGFQQCLTYTKAKLGEIATANPYICARYFDYLMNVFIEVVLNWNMEAGGTRAEGGLFGSAVDDYYAMCASSRFRDALVKYVDAIATPSVPLDLSTCPSCDSKAIESVELERHAFRKTRPGALRPTTTACKDCGANFGGSELILKHAQQRISDAGESESNDEGIFHQIASSQLLPLPSTISASEAGTVSRALVRYQHHLWFHSKSCFKVTRRTPKGDVWRMFIPKESCRNEYINAYVPVINALFKCNHDIKFLSAGEGPEKAYYTMKYSTKDQNDIDNPWALHFNAFDKANSGLSGENNDATIGRRRSQSMCCTLSNPLKGFRSNGMSLPHQGLGVLLIT